ncbi:MAG: hypothetical protein MI746_01015, partial [Pseudomonadales bacterium]|nr:hypothetical protein [Pseudomonadales bacterium]
GPTPVVVMLWSSLIFILIPTAGMGALYYTLALKTRSSSGPFAASAVLIGIWMLAQVVLSEGGIFLNLASVIDPSGFGEVDRLNKGWTPNEKATIIYPLTTPFVLNRLLWGFLPLLWFVWELRKVSREELIQDKSSAITSRQIENFITPQTAQYRDVSSPLEIHSYNWQRTLMAETRWQLSMLFTGKTFYLLLIGLSVMTTASGLVNGLNHADGPFEARPEYTLPLLNESMFLVIAFIAAALVGQVLRRDHRAGIVEILDAAPVPFWVTFIARLAAIVALTFALLLTPAIGSMVLALLDVPHAFNLGTTLIYQTLIVGPALAELVAVTVLVHCLIRKTGTAYATSMLATFIMVVNHEAGLVTYPPLEFGITAHISYSLLTGWGVWMERLLLGDAFKFATVLTLLGFAAMLQIQGLDSRLSHGARALRARFKTPIGAATVLSLLACVFLYSVLDSRFREVGGYQNRNQELATRAAWEQNLSSATRWSVDGGALRLALDTENGTAAGNWRLDGVRSDNERLHLEVPDDLEFQNVVVAGVPTAVKQIDQHVVISLAPCAGDACQLELEFSVTSPGWDAEGEQRWLGAAGVWADASQLAPRLGIDSNKLILAAADRSRFGLPEQEATVPLLALQSATGIAPSGNWDLEVIINEEVFLSEQMEGALDFVVFESARAIPYFSEEITVFQDETRRLQAELVAADAQAMNACVSRRLGEDSKLQTVAQLPRGMGETRFAATTLLLAEEPHWEATESGTSRWRRQSVIASTIAQGVLASRLGLRQNEGAQAFVSGVSGAIGYLCAGDENDVDAVVRLLERASERINRALSSSESPIAEVALDTNEAWLDEYVAAAYVHWVANSSAEALQAMFTTIEQTESVRQGLNGFGGQEFAEQVLGIPNSVELAVTSAFPNHISIERFIWAAGGWSEAGEGTEAIGLSENSSGYIVADTVTPESQVSADSASVALANATAFERSPNNNKITPKE